MRRTDATVERFRIAGEGMNGQFQIPFYNLASPGKTSARVLNSLLNVIASVGLGWDHVSVHVYREQRCPTWEEMCYVKDLFWRSDETVVQFHPMEEEYVNNHPFVLHLWKPQREPIRLPPREMV